MVVHSDCNVIGVHLAPMGQASGLVIVSRAPKIMDNGNVESLNFVMRARLFPPEITYREIQQVVREQWENWDFQKARRQQIVIDETWTGDSVTRELREHGLHLCRVMVDSGKILRDVEGITVIPKRDLVQAVGKVLQEERLRMSALQEGSQELADELRNFGYSVDKKTAAISMDTISERIENALVMALSLAVWWLGKYGPTGLQADNVRGADTDFRDYDPFGRQTR